MPAPAFFPSVVIGYHGCSRRVADSVIAGRSSLRASANSYDRLGAGIYFWKADPLRALEWADDLARRKKTKAPAVVGAIIDPGNCLNLLERHFVSQLKDAYDRLIQMSAVLGTPPPQNKTLPGRPGYPLRNLDCAVVNICRERQVARSNPAFDTVRAAFLEGDSIYPTAGFRDRNHIQICVVNPACIKGYFRPIEDAV
jgi:hypothetical protein